MSKKILLIGHRGGLGSFLMEELPQHGFSVEGRSRTTGHDLHKADDRRKLMEDSLHFDVVIVNSRAGYGQVEFLLELHEFWTERSYWKDIITIGSRASVDFLTRTDTVLKYDYQKNQKKHRSKI